MEVSGCSTPSGGGKPINRGGNCVGRVETISCDETGGAINRGGASAGGGGKLGCRCGGNMHGTGGTGEFS